MQVSMWYNTCTHNNDNIILHVGSMWYNTYTHVHNSDNINYIILQCR